MRSATEQQWDGLIAAYAALAIVIHVLEAGLPTPIPGIKPGLANVITLIVLLRHGWRIAAWVVAMRVLASSLLLGTFLTPTFFLSAGGAIASLFALALLTGWNRSSLPAFSVFGLGMLSACAHMSGQFFLAWKLFIPHAGLFKLLPVMLLAAVLFGIVSALFARSILRRMSELESAKEPI